MSFSGSPHRLRKYVYFKRALAAISLRHRRYTHERALFDIGKRSLDDPSDLRLLG
jgi:hypothetical protein